MKFAFATVGSVLLAVGLADEICYLPLDVMFLQDTTGSFVEDLPNVVRQIPDMVDRISELHPNSHFGVAEFKDKPYWPLGETEDFCYKLGDGKLSPDMSDFEWAYGLLYASGGGDLPEAQYQALINIVLDPAVGWRPLAVTNRAQDMEAGARLIIMSTDAVPHLPGNIDRYPVEQFPDLPRNLPPNSGLISTGDVDYECLFQEYPEPYQVGNALKAANAYVVILTPEDEDIVPAWRWFNEELMGQPAGFYQFIRHDSSDLLEGVLKALAAVTEYACPLTTVAPTEPISHSSIPQTVTTTSPPPSPTTAPVVAPTTPTTTASTSLSTTIPLTTSPAAATEEGTPETPMDCPTCPPGVDPCPPCVPCPDPCNHGVQVFIGDKPDHVVVDIA